MFSFLFPVQWESRDNFQSFWLYKHKCFIKISKESKIIKNNWEKLTIGPFNVHRLLWKILRKIVPKIFSYESLFMSIFLFIEEKLSNEMGGFNKIQVKCLFRQVSLFSNLALTCLLPLLRVPKISFEVFRLIFFISDTKPFKEIFKGSFCGKEKIENFLKRFCPMSPRVRKYWYFIEIFLKKN